MNRFAVTISTLLVAVASFPAVAGADSPEPTALEAFVAKTSVVVEFSQVAGSIRSSDATVEVTAIVASDSADPSIRMRGISLSLQNNTGSDRVYLDESQLAAVQRDLTQIELGIPRLKGGTDAPWRVEGTASCWKPRQPQRILCPSYVVGPMGSRLALAAYGGKGFEFPGHRPSELAALIERAIEAFSAH